MKVNKNKIYLLISVFYVIITVAINLFGYFHLPDVVATQFNFSGEITNYQDTPIYLVSSFLIVAVISILCISKPQEQKLKFFLADTLVVVANIVMIVTQL